jgi:hypothetical protein
MPASTITSYFPASLPALIAALSSDAYGKPAFRGSLVVDLETGVIRPGATGGFQGRTGNASATANLPVPVHGAYQGPVQDLNWRLARFGKPESPFGADYSIGARVIFAPDTASVVPRQPENPSGMLPSH